MDIKQFQQAILEGIPENLPESKPFNSSINRAPKRKPILSKTEIELALRNALRYFMPKYHSVLANEFLYELKTFGRIYMYRFRPDYELKARHIDDFPHKSKQAAAIMLMICNNLDTAVAQHPYELITYGGNGAVFQNWAQYRLTMQYLAEMSDEQTLVMYSGHPMGLFPSHKDAPRVVVSNGMMIPNYSKPDDWERFNALGVTQYGQMTAGSFMYIGPQGIVHGTTLTLLNAARLISDRGDANETKLFITSGLGGMSGAQPKAANIAGVISVTAEINPKAINTRFSQGWVDELIDNLDDLVTRVRKAKANGEVVSIAYQGNVVDVWERFAEENIKIELGSDQTSLHNPWAGGYYPAGLTFEAAKDLMAEQPDEFKAKVQLSLKRHVAAINKCVTKFNTYFFDYGNAFLLESGRAEADIMNDKGGFKYPSYVQDIMGPLCFDYGFGPFRWVCVSNDENDLAVTDEIASQVLEELIKTSPVEIHQQMADNIKWIKQAGKNNLVVGSQARILYSDCQGRTAIAAAFNNAVATGKISAPVIIGRDHHDVSGTDSPYRETSNIYDGSQFTADMAIHNVIGDSFRGATWVSIHNGGGVGWGEVINGGFGMVLDGSDDAARRLHLMLNWDVNNGIARRSWARNEGALFAIKRAMQADAKLKITIPNLVDDDVIDNLYTT
jgi:urocanate hydratase